jgi:RsiW-degrading membrane proteinase PrsW (M82 family)
VPRAAPPLLVAFLGLALVNAAWMRPPLIVLAAAVPALLFALPLVVLGRRRGEPFVLLASAFLWGAVVATWVSLLANDALLAWLPTVAGADTTAVITPSLLGPIVEEVSKTAGLVLLYRVRPSSFDGVRRGIVYGALVGLGFVLTENLTYLMLATLAGGEPGLARAVWTRAVLGGFHHAVFTATIGAALSLGHGRLVPALLGLAAAIAQHVLWNVVAAGRISAILCNAPTADAACATAPAPEGLYVWIPLVVAGALGPGLAVLTLLATRDQISMPASSNSTTSSA